VTAKEHPKNLPSAVEIALATKADHLNPVLRWLDSEWPGSEVFAAIGRPVVNHPGTAHGVVYVTTKPLTFTGSDGVPETRPGGTVLTPDEVETFGGALARMVNVYSVVALPSETGIVGALSSLLLRIDRLEGEIQAATPTHAGVV
jgi:hypothetical protein